MPKNYQNNIYQTTAFDQYPSKEREALNQRRKRIINLRIQSQNMHNYPNTADYFWKQSEIEAKALQEWINNNPPPVSTIKIKQSLIVKFKRWSQKIFNPSYMSIERYQP